MTCSCIEYDGEHNHEVGEDGDGDGDGDGEPGDGEPGDGDGEPGDGDGDGEPGDSEPGDGDNEPGDGETGDADAWSHPDGRWGAPENTFTLPGPAGDGGMYYIDVQASFPDVDWQTLDRLYIPADHYRFINIQNLPHRSPERPLIITNKDGQVKVGGLDFHYLMVIGGGSNWILTGRYDGVAQTGHEDYPGHKYGEFANTAGTYGILIDDEPQMHSRMNNGLRITGATEFEVEFLEIRYTGFAGMNIKTDNNGSAHMENVRLHNNYIHDLISEGFYIGSTQSQPQHQIRNFHIFNNRVLRVGTEAFQIDQVGEGETHVYNNVFGPSAIDWRAAFQNWQDGNLQMAVRGGKLLIYNNIFIGGGDKSFEIQGKDVNSSERQAGDGIFLEDNYFNHTRNMGGYIHATDMRPMVYRIARNQFRGAVFSYDELHPGFNDQGHLIRIATNTTPVELNDNVWESPNDFTNRLSDGNGTNGNVTGSGNVQQSIDPVIFRNAGLPADFDYAMIEVWTDVATRNNNDPVYYAQDTIVTYYSGVFRCLLDPCQPGRVPTEHPDTWEELPPFPDDVRLTANSPHGHVGLTANPVPRD